MDSIGAMKRYKKNYFQKHKKWIIGGALVLIALASLSAKNATSTNLDEIMRTSYLGMRQHVRGIRNNNPLNIKFRASRTYLGKIALDQNTDKEHEQFESLVFGIAAAIEHLDKRYINGAGWSARNCETPPVTFSAPFKTLRQIAQVWAPAKCDPSDRLPGGNNPNNYVLYVTNQTGIDPDEVINAKDRELMKKLIWGMSLYECGGNYKNNILSKENWEKLFNAAWAIYQ
jgi:hypothetical protein